MRRPIVVAAMFLAGVGCSHLELQTSTAKGQQQTVFDDSGSLAAQQAALAALNTNLSIATMYLPPPVEMPPPAPFVPPPFVPPPHCP